MSDKKKTPILGTVFFLTIIFFAGMSFGIGSIAGAYMFGVLK